MGSKRLPAPEAGLQRQVLARLLDADDGDDVSWADALQSLDAKLTRLDELEQRFSAALQREKLASLQQLAYGASHEINNPLANISSRAQMLLRDETDPERRRRLEAINRQAFRAHEMISDLMLFAKPPDLVREHFDLAEALHEALVDLGKQAADQGTRFRVVGAESPCVIWADANYLVVAIQALVRNALEAVSQGGCVTVGLELAAPGDSVCLTVDDTGPGIPPEAFRHLFDPFFSGREAGRGLGFGLSKCWRIVTLHGGSISVESHVEVGAHFTMRLPVDPVTADVESVAVIGE